MNDYLMAQGLNLAFGDWGSKRQAERNWKYQQKQAALQFDYNMQFQKDAQAYQDKAWQRMVNYNDPSAVADRLRQAGFNPYLYNGSLGSQTTSTLPSGGQSSVGMPSGQQSSMPITPFSAVMQHLSNAKLTKYQSDLLGEEAKGKGIDNLTKNMRNLAEITKLMEDTDNKKLLNQYQRVANMFVEDMYEQDYINKVQTNHNLMLQGRSMGFTIAAQALQNSYLPEQLQLDVAMKSADLYTEFQRGKLTEAQFKHELIKTMLTKEQKNSAQVDTFHKTLDYSTASQIAGYIVRKAVAEAETAENNKFPRDPWQSSFKVNDIGSNFYRAGRQLKDLSPLSW